MEARATRMEGGRRLLHHVEEEDLQLDWVDWLLMGCPDNPIIYDPEFRCPCFTLFFRSCICLLVDGLDYQKWQRHSFQLDLIKRPEVSELSRMEARATRMEEGRRLLHQVEQSGGLGFWASGGQTLPLLPRVWSLCRWLLGARLFLQIKGRCFSFQLDSIKPHRKCLLCDLSKTKWNF